MITPNQRLAGILVFVSFLLFLPFLAMQFTSEVDWSAGDFIIAGILLFGTALTCELVLRIVKSTGKRILFCGIVLFILFLVWAELAVGVFGTPWAGS